ncbi:hypothetical protein ABIC83_006159 [Roseateles asaccharophilus]|uniref:Uncharacterized protein n=1 Tax=Roseateles asaccharophilus TaxID=582607 RepID=A0ABU2A9M2_9BURK|nr:hypothetical protein [Roseateles asaccharophilus]
MKATSVLDDENLPQRKRFVAVPQQVSSRPLEYQSA